MFRNMQRSVWLASTIVALLSAASARAGDEIRIEGLRTDRQPDAAAVTEELISQACEEAVDHVLGPVSDDRAAQAQRLRLLERVKSNRRALFTLEFSSGPARNELLGWHGKAAATVSRSAIEKLREDVAGANARPMPTFAVLISERVEYTNWPWGPVPFREDEVGSMIAQQIKNHLLTMNCRVIDIEQHEFLKQKRLDYAKLDGEDAATILSIAKDQGADILIRGRADVTGPRVVDLTEKNKLYMWSVQPKIDAFWTDSAEIVAVPILDAAEKDGGNRFEGPTAARDALDKAGAALARQLIDQILKSSVTAPGPREVTVRIVNTSSTDARDIVKAIRTMTELSPGEPKLEHRITHMLIRTELPTFDLLAKLEDIRLPSGAKLEAKENGSRSIELRVKQ